MNKLTKEQFGLLIKHNVIRENTFVITSIYKNEFRVVTVEETDDGYNLLLKNVDDATKQCKVSYKMIDTIDDMNINRVIQAYSIDDELSIIEINDETDVERDMIGSYEYIFKTSDGRIIELEDGMKIIFHNDATPKYKNKVLTVKGVGSAIKMVAPRGRPKKNA